MYSSQIRQYGQADGYGSQGSSQDAAGTRDRCELGISTRTGRERLEEM